MKGESKSSGGRETMTIPILPWELIIEILLRLPVKSLLRFKCVCKSWLSLLSDPYFAISNFQLFAASTSRVLIIAPPNPEIRSIDFNASLYDDSTTYTLSLDFLSPSTFSNIRLIGSCRGFLLLKSGESLWVWNPSTGVHRKLPSTPFVSILLQPMSYTFLYGFGYDASTDDYLVVKASSNPKHATTRLEFFSFRTNVWTNIESTQLSHMKPSEGLYKGSLLNGAIHWLTCCHDVSMNVIVVFDLTKRSFSEMLLPVEIIDYYDFNTCELGVLGDLLSISFMEWNCSVEVWVMKEYRVQSSWTKIIFVSVENIPVHMYFFPICYTKDGDILGTDCETGLEKFNGMGELQEHRSYCNGCYRSEVTVYTESLLSFPM